MIIILKKGVTQGQIDEFSNALIKKYNVSLHHSKGVQSTIIGLVGDTSNIDTSHLSAQEIVEKVQRVAAPYKQASRKFHPEDTIINIDNVQIGGGTLTTMIGPCSVESEEQLNTIADRVKAAGATMLRGGAFKPRTSPYSFQGLGEKGIELLLEAKKRTGLPIVTEIMGVDQVKYFEHVDLVQVGARNMQNFELLKEIGKMNKPILLKRGLMNTIEETLMSAEYIMSEGNSEVILCERGIRTFEPYTRNTLDLSAVLAFKKLSHLPVIVDPTHASGHPYMIEPLSLAAVAAGADGLMIEVHNNPKVALSDGDQALTPDKYDEVASKIHQLAQMVGKTIQVSN